MFWRTQTKLKGLNPANGIRPNFLSNQNFLADSNNKITILTEQDDIELRISIDPERNTYHILGYIDTIVPDACRTKAIIEINDYNNMGAVAPGVVTDYGLIVFGLWQHTDSKSFSDEIFMDDLFTTMYSIKYGTRQVLGNIEINRFQSN